jgi:hypothetical protein
LLDRVIRRQARLAALAPVGSYGTRNIVVIGMMVFGATDRVYCLDLDLSSILRGIPLSGGVSPSPVFTAVV